MKTSKQVEFGNGCDTRPEIIEYLRKKYMERTGAERFMMGVRSFNAARAMVIASMPKDLPSEEFHRQYYRRIYGEEPPF